MADAGDVRPAGLGDLNRERSDVAGRPVDQDTVARANGPAVSKPETLDGEDAGMRQRGGILERDLVRDAGERCLRRADELRERAGLWSEREQIGEDAVAGAELGCRRPDRFDYPGDVDAQP